MATTKKVNRNGSLGSTDEVRRQVPSVPEDDQTSDRRERIQWLHVTFEKDPHSLLKGLAAAYDSDEDHGGYDSMDSEDRDRCDRMNNRGKYSSGYDSMDSEERDRSDRMNNRGSYSRSL